MANERVYRDVSAALEEGGDIVDRIEAILEAAKKDADRSGTDQIHFFAGNFQAELEEVLGELCEEGERKHQYVFDDAYMVVDK